MYLVVLLVSNEDCMVSTSASLDQDGRYKITEPSLGYALEHDSNRRSTDQNNNNIAGFSQEMY